MSENSQRTVLYSWEVTQYHFVADEMAASLETKAASISNTNCVKITLQLVSK